MGKKICGTCRTTTYTCDKCAKTRARSECAAWAELPPPYGSFNAAHPLMLCDTCNDALITIVFEFAGITRPEMR